MPTPSRAILCAGQPATSTPPIFTDPASGFSTPRISFITVDLPDPLGPIRPRISPGRIEKLMSRTAASAAEALEQILDFEQRRVAHAGSRAP